MQKRIIGTTTNDQLANSFVTMTANFQRLAASEVLIVHGILKQLELEIVNKLRDNPEMSEWRKSRYEALLSQTRENIKAAYTEIADHNQEYMTQIGIAAGKGTAKIFDSVGVPLQSVIVTDEQMAAIAKNTMIQGSPARSWWAKQSTSLQDAFTQQMRLGFASGETVQQLIQRVRGTSTGKKSKYVINGKTRVYTEFAGGIMDTGTRQAEALVRTAIQQMAADAKLDMFRKNADILRGVMWLATLDNRTTLLCRAHDGKLYDLDGKPIGHTLPFLSGPPAHWNCRSTLVPVTKSFEELGVTTGISKEYLDQIGEGTRASMNGQVPASISFDDWFGSLPEKDQISFLGPGKFKIWKEAGLTFSEMIDQRGNPLTISQLAEAYGFSMDESPVSKLPNIPKQPVSAIAVEQRAQDMASEIMKQQEVANRTALEEMLRKETARIRDSNNPSIRAIWQTYKDSLPDDPEQAIAFLQMAVKQEEQAAATLRDLKESIQTGLVSKTSTKYIHFMERHTAMEQVQDIALASQCLVAYENALKHLQQQNKDAREAITAKLKNDAGLADLHVSWQDHLAEKGKLPPAWDMQLYESQFDEFVRDRLTGAMSVALRDIVGSHELIGSTLVIGTMDFDMFDSQGLAAFKKYKAEQLDQYRQSLLAGEQPSRASRLIYDNLSAAEKQAFDDSIALLLRNKQK